MSESWQCTVCGYIHEGLEPPAACPRCGAERSQFIPVAAARVNLLRDMADSFLLHPVAAHFPNGLLPTAALFALLALATGDACLERAVLYLLGVVLAVVPVSVASGLYDWRTRFQGLRARIFYKKLALAASLELFGLAALLLRLRHPELVTQPGALRWLYGALLLALLAHAALLGHYGTKLSFHWKKVER